MARAAVVNNACRKNIPARHCQLRTSSPKLSPCAHKSVVSKSGAGRSGPTTHSTLDDCAAAAALDVLRQETAQFV